MTPVVYYRPEDYVGVSRRLLISLVDISIAGAIALLLSLVVIWSLPTTDAAPLLVLIVLFVVGVLYFVVWKGSRFRTPGYVIAGARIVNFSGERPGYLALLARFVFVVLGPYIFLFDLLWVPGDRCRQALHDKVAHTLVIRKDAVPAGVGRIGYSFTTGFGYALLFAEVQPSK
jgi:uncharacterized RDD family membrane protein YckC